MKKCTVVELNVQIDHVHLVVRTPPSLSVSELMGTLSTNGDKEATVPLSQKEEALGQSFLAESYFVDSVGANEEIIRRYVKYQDKNQKRMRSITAS